MSALYAMYGDSDSAQRAVNGLRQAGLRDDDITVVSALPIEDQEFGEMNKSTWIWYIACAGGFLGLCGSTWLTRMTELAWPLKTGNMPIVAWWPNLIVIFEMTMLGAILATVITLMVTAGLLRRRPKLYDPEVSDGKILVGVVAPASSALPDLERALRAAGAAQLRRT